MLTTAQVQKSTIINILHSNAPSWISLVKRHSRNSSTTHFYSSHSSAEIFSTNDVTFLKSSDHFYSLYYNFFFFFFFCMVPMVIENDHSCLERSKEFLLIIHKELLLFTTRKNVQVCAYVGNY